MAIKRILAAILITVVALAVFTGAGVREVSWEDYQQWLVDSFATISPFPEPVSAIVWETDRGSDFGQSMTR